MWLWFAAGCFLALSFFLDKKSAFRLILGSFLIGSKLLLHHSWWWDEVGWAYGGDYKFREGNCSKSNETIPFDKSKEFHHVFLTHQRWLLLRGNLWWLIGLGYSCFEKLLLGCNMYLMCYYMFWDSLVIKNFPLSFFVIGGRKSSSRCCYYSCMRNHSAIKNLFSRDLFIYKCCYYLCKRSFNCRYQYYMWRKD